MLGQAREDAYGAMLGPAEAQRTEAVYVAVRDADALHGRVTASAAQVVMPLRDTEYGSREFLCRDPEGNLWSFGTCWPRVDAG